MPAAVRPPALRSPFASNRDLPNEYKIGNTQRGAESKAKLNGMFKQQQRGVQVRETQ